MNGKMVMAMTAVLLSVGGFADPGASKDAFLRQQAYAEMQRVSAQIDVIQNNLENLQQRVTQLENRTRNNETADLQAEVRTLRATVADLREAMQRQRGEIVGELSGKIVEINRKMNPPAPPAQPKPQTRQPSANDLEYVVKSKDSLWMVSQAFQVPVAKIREANGLKSDNLKVGQKLIIPGGAK